MRDEAMQVTAWIPGWGPGGPVVMSWAKLKAGLKASGVSPVALGNAERDLRRENRVVEIAGSRTVLRVERVQN